LSSVESVAVPFLTIGIICIVTYLLVVIEGKIDDRKKDRIEKEEAKLQ